MIFISIHSSKSESLSCNNFVNASVKIKRILLENSGLISEATFVTSLPFNNNSTCKQLTTAATMYTYACLAEPLSSFILFFHLNLFLDFN